MRSSSGNFQLLSLVIGLMTLLAPMEVLANDQTDPLAMFPKQPENYRLAPHYLYHKLFSPRESHISKQYEREWAFDESQKYYNKTSVGRDRLLVIASIHHADRAARQAHYANAYFRTRMDSLFRNLISESASGTKKIRRLQQSLQKVNDLSLSMSGDTEQNRTPSQYIPNHSKPIRSEIRMGYNLFNDNSHLAWHIGAFSTGLRHPRFLRAITHSDGESLSTSEWSMGVSIADWGISTGATYRLDANNYHLHINKQFSATVSGSIRTRQGLKPELIDDYQASVTIHF